MIEEDFRAVCRGGVWWVERFQCGTWSIYYGPYKYRKGAEARLRAEQTRKTPVEVK